MDTEYDLCVEPPCGFVGHVPHLPSVPITITITITHINSLYDSNECASLVN